MASGEAKPTDGQADAGAGGRAGGRAGARAGGRVTSSSGKASAPLALRAAEQEARSAGTSTKPRRAGSSRACDMRYETTKARPGCALGGARYK